MFPIRQDVHEPFGDFLVGYIGLDINDTKTSLYRKTFIKTANPANHFGNVFRKDELNSIKVINNDS